jgi:hypothetical protein
VAGGTTLLLTTQYLDEADELADEIVVIDHGLVIAAGTSKQLKDRVGGDVLEFTVPDRTRRSDAVTAISKIGESEPLCRPRGSSTSWWGMTGLRPPAARWTPRPSNCRAGPPHRRRVRGSPVQPRRAVPRRRRRIGRRLRRDREGSSRPSRRAATRQRSGLGVRTAPGHHRRSADRRGHRHRRSPPDENVAIIVGSSSHATHRVVGSVTVSLARHSPVPVIIVP